MRENLDDHELWRGDVLQIILRINGKCFTEAFNRCLDVDLNLALYLIKFLKFTPEQAVEKVNLNLYGLLNKAKNLVIDSDQILKCRGV